MNELTRVLGATAGGLLPALAWLWFWLREDREHPEPRFLIFIAFIAGSLTVGIVIPMEQFVAAYLTANPDVPLSFGLTGQTLTFLSWSAIEEVMKFAAAAATVLWTHADDE